MKALHVTQGAALLAKLEKARAELEESIGVVDVLGIDDLTFKGPGFRSRISDDAELVERLVAVIMAEVLKTHRARVRELRLALISLGVELEPDLLIEECAGQ